VEIAGQRLGRTSLTRRNVGGSHTPGNHTAETALPGWGERTRTRRRRFPTVLRVASAMQLNSADVPSTCVSRVGCAVDHARPGRRGKDVCSGDKRSCNHLRIACARFWRDDAQSQSNLRRLLWRNGFRPQRWTTQPKSGAHLRSGGAPTLSSFVTPGAGSAITARNSFS
jgi:hypothetical protein